MDRQTLGLLGSAGVGAGLGAGLMYLLDPDAGGRRRARARDKAARSLKRGGKAALKTSHDLGNRTRGLVAGAASRLRKEEVDDRVLSERVRAKIGRVVSPAGIGTALGAVGLGLLARGLKNRGLSGFDGGGAKSLLHRRNGEVVAGGESLAFGDLGASERELQPSLP